MSDSKSNKIKGIAGRLTRPYRIGVLRRPYRIGVLRRPGRIGILTKKENGSKVNNRDK
ncbi:MAG: hypothetical protein IIA88_09220 [Bacteroidetes bacterium]|nr:hypothetical protein [Bacteroidota bacterium]